MVLVPGGPAHPGLNLPGPIMAALRRCRDFERGFFRFHRPDHGGRKRRWFAIGDPQTSALKFFQVLHRHGLLASSGWLRQDCGLLSMGDHFDFQTTAEEATAFDNPVDLRRWMGSQGLLILKWLATHPPDHIAILWGNHDLSRVQELGGLDDQSFAEALKRGEELEGPGTEEQQDEAAQAFRGRFASIGNPKIVTYYYPGFDQEQKRWMRRFIKSGRGHLALSGTLKTGQPILLSHGGFTTHQLKTLEVSPAATPRIIAQATQRFFKERSDAVAALWDSGRPAKLDIAPLARPMGPKSRGGGILLHRPVDPLHLKEAADLKGDIPLRFDPRTLPAGLNQACGHVGHQKCVEAMPRWLEAGCPKISDGQIRTLRVEGQGVHYAHRFLAPGDDAVATLYLIDGRIQEAPVQSFELLPLRGLEVDTKALANPYGRKSKSTNSK